MWFKLTKGRFIRTILIFDKTKIVKNTKLTMLYYSQYITHCLIVFLVSNSLWLLRKNAVKYLEIV